MADGLICTIFVIARHAVDNVQRDAAAAGNLTNGQPRAGDLGGNESPVDLKFVLPLGRVKLLISLLCGSG